MSVNGVVETRSFGIGRLAGIDSSIEMVRYLLSKGLGIWSCGG